MTFNDKESIKKMLIQIKQLISNIESKLNETMESVGTFQNSKSRLLEKKIRNDISKRISKNVSKPKH